MPTPFSWLVDPVLRLWSWNKRAFSSNKDQQRPSSFDFSTHWGSLSARRQRYAFWWAFYESTIYEDIHVFAQVNKTELGLYEDIAPIANPVSQICNFWHTHLWGGSLDPAAGDGQVVPSALPIVIDAETEGEEGQALADELRAAIARLWRDSVWQVNKDVAVLQGTVKGDVGIAIVDDRERKKVCLEVIAPDDILDYQSDLYGNCRSYVLERRVPDPRWKVGSDEPQGMVRYREICWRGEGETVHFETYLDDQLYPWNGEQATWEVDYGFVPFVLIANIKYLPGSPFGAPECHTARERFHSLDHVASMTMDNIGKLNDPIWLYAGVPNPAEAIDVPGDDPTDAAPRPRRAEQQSLYTTDPNAKAQALVAATNISHVNAWFNTQYEMVKRDYPELRLDMEFASGDASGRALRVSRQRLERKGSTRRGTWDEGMVRAHKMGVSVGALNGYDGYTSFDKESYARGELDHRIADRSLFQVDPEDRLDLEAKEAKNADTWAMAGVPVLAYGMLHGWSKKRLETVRAMQEFDLKRGLTVGRSKQQAQGGVGNAGDPGPATVPMQRQLEG